VTEEENSKSNTLATKEDLANAKADIIKWMFILWISQTIIVALIKLITVLF